MVAWVKSTKDFQHLLAIIFLVKLSYLDRRVWRKFFSLALTVANRITSHNKEHEYLGYCRISTPLCYNPICMLPMIRPVANGQKQMANELSCISHFNIEDVLLFLYIGYECLFVVNVKRLSRWHTLLSAP